MDFNAHYVHLSCSRKCQDFFSGIQPGWYSVSSQAAVVLQSGHCRVYSQGAVVLQSGYCRVYSQGAVVLQQGRRKQFRVGQANLGNFKGVIIGMCACALFRFSYSVRSTLSMCSMLFLGGSGGMLPQEILKKYTPGNAIW